MKTWIIYMYTFPNGKRYIGTTSRTLAQRQGANWQGYRRCTHLWRAIQKYGYKNIQQSILLKAIISAEQAGILEKNYIAYYDTANPEIGYNIRVGGDGASLKTMEQDRLDALRERTRQLGRCNKGRVVSDETREKQRAAKLGKKRHPLSTETKAKIASANSAKNMTEATRKRRSLSKQKKVVAESNITGDIFTFPSVTDAAQFFNVRLSRMSEWIAGKHKPPIEYTFRFISPTTTE